jgi:hypothetical protein
VAKSLETIDQVIRTFRQAAEANRQTPSRQGNLIGLGPEVADDLMVTADLHGNRTNFSRICQIADLTDHPRRHLIIQEVCHGGPRYSPGNGCMSHRLLEEVAALKVIYPDRFHFLLSNHELAELTDFPIVKASQILNVLFRCGLTECYGAETDRVRRAYADFLFSCPLAVRTSNRIVVCHSAPDRADADSFDTSVLHRPLQWSDLTPGGAVFRMVWGRDYRPANAETFARLLDAHILIHGHEPCPDGYLVPNPTQIILDSSTESGTYVLVPVGRPCTQTQIVQQIQRLQAGCR